MFCSIFRENIRSILHDVTKEDEQYVIIMPDYSVEEATKITKGYSIVNSSNSSAVTKSRVDLSHHQDHCSKSNADVSISSCIGHYDHDKFSSNGKANINLKQKFKRSSKKQRNQCKI